MIQAPSERTFIYGLLDPRSGEIRYVGKSSRLNERFKQHLKDAENPRTYKGHWLAELAALGIMPEVIVLEEVVGENWGERERYWIAGLRKAGRLCNLTDGGEGFRGQHTEEAKQKIGAASKGRLVTQQRREKISCANKGRKRTAEQRARMSRAALGRTVSEDTRKKIGAGAVQRSRGELCGTSKLTSAQVALIREEYLSGNTTLKKLGQKYGVSRSAVAKIIHNISWVDPSYVPPSERLTRRGSGVVKLTKQQVLEIRLRYAGGETCFEHLAKDYPVCGKTIAQIVRGEQRTYD